MDDYDIGYKKPPTHSRFKPGNRANPRGRTKQNAPTEADIIKNVLNFPVQFLVGGKPKRAPRIELLIKRFGAAALKGDVGAAAMLLKMREHFQKHGEINPTKLRIIREIVYPGDVVT